MDRIKIIATLKWVHDLLQSNGVTEPLEDVDDCIVMLKMEQRASVEQEPVAWMIPEYGDVLPKSQADGTGIYNIPLYTAPPRKEWVGLTEEDVVDLYCQVGDCTEWAIGGLKDAMPFAELVEAKLKEKNGG